MDSAYPKFVCPECNLETHCLVNPVTCSNCGGTLYVEDDIPESDIPMGLWYWSQQQKERALDVYVAAHAPKGILELQEFLAGEEEHGSQDQEENLS